MKNKNILPIFFLTFAFVLFSLIIPIIQDNINKKIAIEVNRAENAAQSHSKIALAQNNLDMASLLIALSGPNKPSQGQDVIPKKATIDRIQQLIKHYTDQANGHMYLSTIAIYFAINDNSPAETLLTKWDKMNYKQLESEQQDMLKNFNVDSHNRSNNIAELDTLKLWLYGFAAMFYILGIVLQIKNKY